MGFFSLFFLCLLFASGSSNGERPLPEAIQIDEIPDYPENQMIPFSDSVFTNQRDTIPVVTPDPIFDSPPSPMTTQPIITPVIPPPVTLSPPAMPVTRPPPMTPVTTTPVSSSGGSWCVASQVASDTALQVALDYACGYGGADCTGIQPGSSCYNPNTLRDHASYAFNSYYQKNPAPTSCVFGGSAQLTTTDPSSGSCRYAASRASTSISPPTTPTPMMPSPTVPSPFIASPMMPNTPTFDTPPGSSIYGSEPTGTPSSAVSVSYSRLFVFLTTGLLGSILAVAYQ